MPYFTDGEDSLDLTAFGTDYDAMDAAGAFSDVGGDTVIDLSALGGTGTITLLGYLGAADFNV